MKDIGAAASGLALTYALQVCCRLIVLFLCNRSDNVLECTGTCVDSYSHICTLVCVGVCLFSLQVSKAMQQFVYFAAETELAMNSVERVST